MRARSAFSPWAIGLALSVLVAGCGTDPKKVNESCAADADCETTICHASICASTTPKADGEACQGAGDCKSYRCEGAKCVAGTTKEGTQCLSLEECVSRNCDGGTCALKKDGAACAADLECTDGICYDKKCAKKCAGQDGCGAKQDCSTDDGKRLFCMNRGYPSWLGMSCAVDGKCPVGATCVGTVGDAAAFCTLECTDDHDCPATHTCGKSADKLYCLANGFCSACYHDDNCPTGQSCVSFGGEKFCTKSCNKSATECPMFAECKDTGGGSYNCVHKAGRCKGNGGLCSPCTREEDCSSGGQCLTYNLSFESFCGSDCTSSGTCPNRYSCSAISQTDKQCTPDPASADAMPTCTKGLTLVGNPGDVMDDFAVVGLRDKDGDNDLTDERLEIVRLSDFKDKKIILYNISAFW